MSALIGPHLERRERGETHPVIDFLFTYYSYRPNQLLRWHPGWGTVLAGGDEYAELRGYHRTDAGSPSTRSSCSAARTRSPSPHD